MPSPFVLILSLLYASLVVVQVHTIPVPRALDVRNVSSSAAVSPRYGDLGLEEEVVTSNLERRVGIIPCISCFGHGEKKSQSAVQTDSNTPPSPITFAINPALASRPPTPQDHSPQQPKLDKSVPPSPITFATNPALRSRPPTPQDHSPQQPNLDKSPSPITIANNPALGSRPPTPQDHSPTKPTLVIPSAPAAETAAPNPGRVSLLPPISGLPPPVSKSPSPLTPSPSTSLPPSTPNDPQAGSDASSLEVTPGSSPNRPPRLSALPGSLPAKRWV